MALRLSCSGVPNVLSMLALTCTGSSAAAQTAGWHEVVLSPHVSVMLPEGAKRFQSAKLSPKGQEMWVFQAGPTVFEVSASKWDPKSPKDSAYQELAATVAGRLDAVKGNTLKSQRDIMLNGWPGIEFVVLSPDKLAAVQRSYAVEDKLYLIGVDYLSTLGRP